MKSITRKIAASTLGVLLACPWHTFVPVQAQSLKEVRTQQQALKPSKLAPDLEILLADDDEEQRQALQGKTLAQVRQNRRTRATQRAQEDGEDAPQRTRLGGLLLPSSETLAEEKQSFIVQVDSSIPQVVWQEKLARLGGQVRQSHGKMGLLTIEAPRTAIRHLAAERSIAYVSPNRLVTAMGHLENTTGTALIRSLAGKTILDGKGIGIAILDSGIDDSHKLTWASNGHPGVVGKQDYTGQDAIKDRFGHGSHVASLAAGGKGLKTGTYTGIAPGANLLAVKVLNDNGQGIVSNVIAALDWCITNKATYNLRVINLSLGTIAKDSYANDPLCLAARRAVNAGIVVVAAAGNDGKNSAGQKIYGGIHSPGIEPSVITVGAANTFGTDARADDTMASYSSRGPTRGYVTINGVRKYDNLIKPDLVAPGNKLVGARSNNPDEAVDKRNRLTLDYPALSANITNKLEDRVMYLSGTSMATPVVAGTAALMLQANPALTPNLIKAILMYTAQPLANANMMEQGAGLLNVDGAVRLARLVKTTLPTTVGTALLTAALPTQQSTIAGQTFNWGRGVITNWGFLSGTELMTQWQSVYGTGQILGDATICGNGVFSKVASMTSSGVVLKTGAFNITTNGQVLGDGVIFADAALLAQGQVLGDGTILGDGIILGDGVILGDGTILGDSTTRANGTLRSLSAFLGDNTACMQP
ncbi:MAG: S8 family serine peptidase [Blastocatellia bacterium]|nr:S8 family serine peptidase [Blastocatellia bacterium]